jgi:hypothetical protein
MQNLVVEKTMRRQIFMKIGSQGSHGLEIGIFFDFTGMGA